MTDTTTPKPPIVTFVDGVLTINLPFGYKYVHVFEGLATSALAHRNAIQADLEAAVAKAVEQTTLEVSGRVAESTTKEVTLRVTENVTAEIFAALNEIGVTAEVLNKYAGLNHLLVAIESAESLRLTREANLQLEAAADLSASAIKTDNALRLLNL